MLYSDQADQTSHPLSTFPDRNEREATKHSQVTDACSGKHFLPAHLHGAAIPGPGLSWEDYPGAPGGGDTMVSIVLPRQRRFLMKCMSAQQQRKAFPSACVLVQFCFQKRRLWQVSRCLETTANPRHALSSILLLSSVTSLTDLGGLPRQQGVR